MTNIPAVESLERQAVKINIPVINAAEWVQTDPPTPDQILENVFDAGDKVTIIAPSKSYKTFLVTQLAARLASGEDFLNCHVCKPRSVLLVQLEVRKHHYHRRINRMVRALDADIGNNLHIINARGLELNIADIETIAQFPDIQAEVVIIDPIYKLISGDENKAEHVKPILKEFDQIAEATGATIIYTHHDPKGNPADRATRDRGAGSNVISRDYDACLTLTAHRDGDDILVLSTLLRNYPPRDDVVIQWIDGCFHVADHLPAVTAKTAGNKNTASALPATQYIEDLLRLLGDQVMQKCRLVDELRTKIGLTRDKAIAVIGTAEDQKIIERFDRNFPKKVYFGIPEAIRLFDEEFSNPRLFDEAVKQETSKQQKRQ